MKIDVILAIVLVVAVVMQFLSAKTHRFARPILVISLLLVGAQFLKKEYDESRLTVKIKNLQSGQDLIQSITIRSVLEIYTAPREPGGGSSIFGPGDVIGLVVQSPTDTSVIRFATGGHSLDQQVDSFTLIRKYEYVPEMPSAILGKSIDFLERVSGVRTNYLQDFGIAEQRFNDGFGSVTLEVIVNGVEVVNTIHQVPVKSKKLSGFSFSVSKEFQLVPTHYREARNRVSQ